MRFGPHQLGIGCSQGECALLHPLLQLFGFFHQQAVELLTFVFVGLSVTHRAPSQVAQ